jgi:hypothetical protein
MMNIYLEIQFYANTVDPHTVDLFANPLIHENSNTVDLFFLFFLTFKEINPYQPRKFKINHKQDHHDEYFRSTKRELELVVIFLIFEILLGSRKKPQIRGYKLVDHACHWGSPFYEESYLGTERQGFKS